MNGACGDFQQVARPRPCQPRDKAAFRRVAKALAMQKKEKGQEDRQGQVHHATPDHSASGQRAMSWAGSRQLIEFGHEALAIVRQALPVVMQPMPDQRIRRTHSGASGKPRVMASLAALPNSARLSAKPKAKASTGPRTTTVMVNVIKLAAKIPPPPAPDPSHSKGTYGRWRPKSPTKPVRS